MNKIRGLAALLGFLGVALGAFGAHALKSYLIEHGVSDVWEKAVIYNLVHAVAAFAGTMASPRPSPCLLRAIACWMIGVVLFSGSLYGYALGGPHWSVFVTPLGGVTFLIGWGFAIADGFSSGATEKK